LPEAASTAKPFPSNLSPRSRVLFSVLCGLFALYFAHSAAGIASAASAGLISIANFAGLGRIFGSIADFGDLLTTASYLFLLLVAFSVMARWLNGHRRPLILMGLQPRTGWLREWGIGAALGWGIITLTVLPMALAGSLHYSFAITPVSFWLFLLNTLVILVASLAEQVIYRGYPFQRMIDGLGPMPALIVMSTIFTAIHWHDAYVFSLSRILVVLLGSILLSLAYIRTRALWLVWGLHFAWNFSEGALFGLPVGGFTRFSTVVQADTTGPVWLTGGDFGPEASQLMVIVLLVAIAVLVYVTRDYNWTYNAPVILAGGIPVEVAPPAAHTAAEKAAAAPSLVQILPIATPPKSESNDI